MVIQCRYAQKHNKVWHRMAVHCRIVYIVRWNKVSWHNQTRSLSEIETELFETKCLLFQNVLSMLTLNAELVNWCVSVCTKWINCATHRYCVEHPKFSHQSHAECINKFNQFELILYSWSECIWHLNYIVVVFKRILSSSFPCRSI